MVCSDVTLDDLVDFHTGIEDFDYGAEATIFSMGAPTDAVYCIRTGAVKMVRFDQSGNSRIVRVLKKGDVAGLESAFSDNFEHSAIAASDVHACRIPISLFRHFITTHPALQGRLFEKSQAALRDAESWLAHLVGGTIPIRTRLARLLLRLRMGSGDRIYRFSLDDMAAILGTTPESVSRTVSEFVRLGLLEKGRGTATNRHFRGNIAGLEEISREGKRPGRIPTPPTVQLDGPP